MIILSDSEQRLFPRKEGWSLVICVVPRDDEVHAVHQGIAGPRLRMHLGHTSG